MRIKPNHFNLGLFYEACLVCPIKFESYFKKVASVLEECGIKTGVFVYGKDTLTKQVQRMLKQSYSVAFWLCRGSVEYAVENEDSSLRQVFSFVQKYNPNSISLATADSHQIDTSLQFPDDMRSFDWLHRKNMPVMNTSEEDMAYTLYDEFRRNHHRREESKLKLLNNSGLNASYDMYKVLFFTCLTVVAAPLLFWLLGLLGRIPQVAILCGILKYVFLVAGFLSSCFIPCYWMFQRDKSLDVSTTFANFHARTRLRLCILGIIGLAACEVQGLIYMQELLKPQYTATDLSFLIPYGLLWIPAVPTFVMVCIYWWLSDNSRLYLEFSGRRIRARFFILPFFILAAVLVYVYLKTFFKI